MIRIRFFGPGELIQNGFRAARYTNDVMCNDQKNMDEFRDRNRNSVQSIAGSPVALWFLLCELHERDVNFVQMVMFASRKVNDIHIEKCRDTCRA